MPVCGLMCWFIEVIYLSDNFSSLILKCGAIRAKHCWLLYLSLSSTSRARVALWCRSSSRACSMVQENWGKAGRESRACWELNAFVWAWVDSVLIWRTWSGRAIPGAWVCLKFRMREPRCPWSSFTHWIGSAQRFRSPFSNRKSSSSWTQAKWELNIPDVDYLCVLFGHLGEELQAVNTT